MCVDARGVVGFGLRGSAGSDEDGRDRTRDDGHGRRPDAKRGLDRDLLTFHNELFDEANAKVVGSDQGDCVRIEAGVSWECRWVNVLEGGSITVEGPFFDAKGSALAITGGTGLYRGARGSMRLLSANDAGTEFEFTFRILTG